jgi:ATP-binding cassette subfamily F protein uup
VAERTPQPTQTALAAMPIATLSDLTIRFHGPPVLDGVSRQIEAGERIGLLGRNGAGKTTLLRIIAGEEVPDAGSCTVGDGIQVAFLPQEVPRDLTGAAGGVVRLALEAAVVSGSLEAWQAETKAVQTLEQLGIAAEADVGAMSAGLKRRVLLARAIATAPDLLLLDEPTNHLDLESIGWLESFLEGWSGTLMFVTHDRGFLRRIAGRIWEIDRGRLFDWSCDYDTFLSRKAEVLAAEEKQNALFDKRLAEEEAWIRQGIKARRTRNEGRVRALEAMRLERSRRRDQPGKAGLIIQEAARSGTLVCEAKGISFAFGDQPIVRDFSTTILRGDRVGIIGPNGVGKTTLLRLLLGELAPQAGDVRTGTNLAVAYFDQLRGQLDPEKSVVEQINGGNDFVTIDGQKRHVIGYLQDFLFSAERARLPVQFLSGGERHRVLLAKLFTQPANVIVLDEPTNDLDLETLEILEARLVEFAGTVLVVSHDREFLDRVVTSVVAYEPDGPREYVGGYSDWLRQRRPAVPRDAPSAGASPQKAVTVAVGQPSSPARKRSYKEQRELDLLPARIESLEAAIAEIHAAMAESDFYRQPAAEIAAAQERLRRLQAETAEAFARWEVLES